MSLFRGTKNQHILLGILKIQIYHKTNICLPLEFRKISSNQQDFRHGFYFLRKQQFSQQKITHLHKIRGLGQTGSIFFEMLYARAYYYQVLCQFYLKYSKKGIKGKLNQPPLLVLRNPTLLSRNSSSSFGFCKLTKKQSCKINLIIETLIFFFELEIANAKQILVSIVHKRALMRVSIM